MNEQRNLYLAIGISIAIIIFFQILLPTQPIQPPTLNENETLEPATSIDGQSKQIIETIKSREDILITTKRVSFKNSSVEGSINLKGAIIDDLILSKYKTSLETDSDNIQLLLPDGTANPYYIETGWKELNNSNIDLPNLNTEWQSNNSVLSPSNPVSLIWTNNQNVTFYREDFLKYNFINLKNKFDLVLSDIAPNTTGHQSTDHLRISQLIYEVIDRLEIILKKQGSFIFKIWKGEEEKEIIKMLKKIFDKVEYFKPKSSRQESSEIFIISKGFRLNEK